MKTLIFNGSPRKKGDTAALLRILKESLRGEYREVDCYRENISPCIDCRSCRKELKCVLNDGMQEIYRYIEECDNVVIASPIYYSELSGKLLDAASRFQMYYSARYFRREEPGIRPKKGGVILVCSHGTNTLPAAEDEEAVRAVGKLAEFLNG